MQPGSDFVMICERFRGAQIVKMGAVACYGQLFLAPWKIQL